MKATPASMPSRRLEEVAPEFVVELERLLVWQGASAIANQVSELTLLDRCRCGDSFCGSFYTAPRPNGPFGPGHRTIPLWSDSGIVNTDVVGLRIVYVEVLRRNDLRDKIVAAVP